VDVVAVAPALLALAVCLLSSPARALLLVYMPVLLLLPAHPRWVQAGLPDLGFLHAAILPIAFTTALTVRRWRPSAMDGLVLLLLLLRTLSQLRTDTWKDTQDNVFDWVCLMVLPYAVARGLVQQAGADLRVHMARSIVVLLAFVALLSVWEFRMGSNPLFVGLWEAVFPSQVRYLNQYRGGFARVTGPFTHSILAGILFGVGVLLQVWLHAGRHWRNRHFSLLLLCMLCMGSLMTLSRGPWIGLAAGLGCMLVGFSRDRRRAVVTLAVLLVFLGLPAMLALRDYVAVDLADAGSEMQANAAYRREIFDLYTPTLMQRPWLGWGVGGWPTVRNRESVDNQYLLMSLDHGLLTTGVFVLLLGSALVRLLRHGLVRKGRLDDGRLAITLLAAILCVGVSIGTVWLGAQTMPLLFLLLGWAESVLQAGAGQPAAADPMRAAAVHPGRATDHPPGLRPLSAPAPGAMRPLAAAPPPMGLPSPVPPGPMALPGGITPAPRWLT